MVPNALSVVAAAVDRMVEIVVQRVVVYVPFLMHLLAELRYVQVRLQPQLSIHIFLDCTHLKFHVFPHQIHQFQQGVP